MNAQDEKIEYERRMNEINEVLERLSQRAAEMAKKRATSLGLMQQAETLNLLKTAEAWMYF